MQKEYRSFINRPFMFLCFMNFLINITFNMTSPIIPRYAISLGASATISGVLAGIFSITALVVRPFSGALAGNVNKRLMIAGGVGLMAIGIGFGQPGIQAECVKLMRSDQRGLATSMYYLGCDFFQGIGPVVGGAITDASGSYANNFFAACALMMTGFVSYSIFALPRRKRD